MSAADIQALLRFFTQDAKIPLGVAMSKVKEMQNAHLASPEDMAKSKLEDIKAVFTDEKLSKQIHSAAKRLCKKRTSDGGAAPTPAKRKRADPFETPALIPAREVEQSLELPITELGETELAKAVLVTNRAPLVLAFAVILLRYTMPEQPLSSRLSLAQAVVSMNSQTKAKSIGLTKGKTAEDEGWGQGQPVVKVMNREISVLKRWGYDWKVKPEQVDQSQNGRPEANDRQADASDAPDAGDEPPALWAIDLDQLKNLNGPLTFNATSSDTSGLPVYSPQSARSYMLRSFESAPNEQADIPVSPTKPKKKTAAASAAEREANVAALLKSLDLLFESWASILTTSELDQRAWNWYVRVRPEVEHGVAGWGAKGQLKLSDILDLRRKG